MRRGPLSLSHRSQRVLEALRDNGVAEDARADWLQRAAGSSERDVYDALVTLKGRLLVRWNENGRQIRITEAGRRLLAAAYYRDRRLPRA